MLNSIGRFIFDTAIHLRLPQILGALIFVFARSLFAGEGFNHDPTLLPQSVQKVWNSVFMILPNDVGGLGSAVLVSKRELPAPNSYELTFLTSGHVVSKTCGNSIGFCNNIELSTGKAFEAHSMREVSSEDGLTILGANVVRRFVSPDLALLKVIVQGRFYSELTPITISSDCKVEEGQQVFVIGHPYVLERKTINLPYKEYVTKRWSSGYVVKNDKLVGKAGVTLYVTGSTADSLEGNSGGATVNLRGELIGIHIGSRVLSSEELRTLGLDLNETGKPYVGNENSNRKEYHAAFSRCEYLESFVKMRPLSPDPEDYYKKPRSSSTYQSNVEKSYSK